MNFLELLRRWAGAAKPPAGADESFFRSLAEQVSDVICRVGPNGRMTYVSPSIEALLGYKPADLVGQDAMLPVLEEDRASIEAGVVRLMSGEIKELRTQARARRSDGSVIWVETTAKAAPGFDGSAVLVLRDITDRKQIEEDLSRLALQDGLTGLANRRAFDQTLDREWRRTVRELGQMTLLMIDVDHFKQFNDEFGHQAGDDCLRSVSACIQAQIQRPGDVAFRYGGEEIAVILGGADVAGALEMAERLRAAVEALAIPHGSGGVGPVLTISIGAATALSRDGGTMRMPESLLQAADHALYRAKSEGRNRVSHSLLFAPGDR